jgi:hypothetical protein
MMADTFRAVIRRSYLESGMPRVSREVAGLFPTRKEAEEACSRFAKAQGDAFRAAYDDWVVELVRAED